MYEGVVGNNARRQDGSAGGGVVGAGEVVDVRVYSTKFLEQCTNYLTIP